MNLNDKTKKTLLASMIGLFAAGGMGTVQAQEQEQVGESARAQRALDEIIVTAQKREQNLQDVGLAVSAITGEGLIARGIDDAYDLQSLIPALSLSTDSTGTTAVTLRGVGVVNVTPGGDPSVPMHIDGHYIQSSAFMARDFLDVERIEVLRGPQGTLYGRNAIGGTINVITNKPSDDFEGKLGVEVGNYNKVLVQGIVSGPITDNIRGRLVVSDDNRDGFVENVSPLGEQDVDNSDYTSTRGSLDIDVSENVSLSLSAFYFDDKGNTVAKRPIDETYSFTDGVIDYYEVNGAGPNITAQDPRKVRWDAEMDQSDIAKGASIDLDWDLGGMLFRSLSSYAKDKKLGSNDQDGYDVVAFSQTEISTFHETFSQEFQLISSPDSKIKWISGLFYYTENSGFISEISIPNGTVVGGPALEIVAANDVEASSFGVFGQVEFPLIEDLDLIVGGRYNKDKKDTTHSLFIPFFGLVGPDGGPAVTDDYESGRWSEASGKIGLNYHLSDDVLTYASISTGYKAGGFNFGQLTPYDPESVLSYEVGIKGQWADNRIQANLNTFYYDYKDKQELVSNGLLIGVIDGIVNAGDATVWGVELESTFSVSPSLVVDATISSLNTKYENLLSNDVANLDLGLQDLSGNELPYSPEYKAHIGVEYQWDIPSMGQFSARIDASWVDQRYSTFFNRDLDSLESYHRTNAQIKWNSNDQLWEARLYVQNLEDDDVLENILEGPALTNFGRSGQFLPPRTYGLNVTHIF